MDVRVFDSNSKTTRTVRRRNGGGKRGDETKIRGTQEVNGGETQRVGNDIRRGIAVYP